MKFSHTLLKKIAPKIPEARKFAEVFPLHAFEVEGVSGDTIDISIPANRYSDASSHWGIALLSSAIFGGQLKEPALANLKPKSGSKNFSVKIASPKLCFRYSGLYAEVKIKSSPAWLQKVLTACGLRPINNVVDVMNYVMLEVGQPMHAFDADELQMANGHAYRQAGTSQIAIRTAKNKEKIIAIDGGSYELSSKDLVIADSNGLLAIAGIKGGKRAEVNIHTKRIIVEAANFDSVSVYKTSKRIELATDASARFGHGLSPVLVERGIRRAAWLLKEVCGAEIGDWLDVGATALAKRGLKFDIRRFNQLTGLDLSEKICLDYLKKLGFGVKGLLAEIPAERTDVAIFEDLAEEIVNLYGYDKLPSQIPSIAILPSGYEDSVVLKDKLRQIMTGFGFSEVYNYSFAGSADSDQAVKLSNPISEDKKYLRPNLTTALMKNVDDNLRFYDEVRIFEIGKAFLMVRGTLEERMMLGIAIGLKSGAPVLEMKGLAEQLLESAGLVDHSMIEEHPANLRVESDGQVLGFLEARHPKRAFLSLDLDKLLKLVSEEREFQPLPKYPSVMRDISVVVSGEQRVGPVQNLLENASHLLSDMDLIDWFEDPKKLGPNRKSLTFRLVFQSEDRTLTDEEVGREMEKIVNVLKNKFEIEVR